jgi:hypothetical protein
MSGSVIKPSEAGTWVSNRYTERRKDYEPKDFAVQLLVASPLNTTGVMYTHFGRVYKDTNISG